MKSTQFVIQNEEFIVFPTKTKRIFIASKISLLAYVASIQGLAIFRGTFQKFRSFGYYYQKFYEIACPVLEEHLQK